MKFKHTFHVFVDNFAVTYKQLLYRLVIGVIFSLLSAAVIYPFVQAGTPEVTNLLNGFSELVKNLVEGEPGLAAEATRRIRDALEALAGLITQHRGDIALGITGLVFVYIVQKFFAVIGNYATAAVINDKMALHANSPFMTTLVHNLKPASLYALMYVPLSFLYDFIVVAALFFLVFYGLAFLHMIVLQLFLFVTAVVIAVSFKMVFTTDWLPSLIRGKMNHGHAFLYTFDRKKKNTFNVLSNFVVLIVIIFGLNVAGIVFTFGTAALITIPSSYVILMCFEFVNFYDREELKYFIDKNTIIKPDKEKAVTREQFFRGE